MEPGIYPNLSNEQYHSDAAISRSGIMDFLDSPYKYWANYISVIKPNKKITDAMRFGSAFHAYVLEPKLFNKEYDVEPRAVLLKDVGRELYDNYKMELEKVKSLGKIIISSDELSIICQMNNALMNHEKAWPLIEGATYEQSYFWEDEHTGIMCKARPDILHSNMIVDLKTCTDASTRAYQRAMVDGGYHIQGAMIREGIKQCTGVDIKTVINICVEKCYPYGIGIKIISEDALEHGHKQFKQALLDLKSCREKDEWPSYEAEIVELPSWAKQVKL